MVKAAAFAATIIFAVSCAPVGRTPLPSAPAQEQEQEARERDAVDALGFQVYLELMGRLCGVPPLSRTVTTAAAVVTGTSNGQRVSGEVWIGADHYNGSLRVESVAPSQFVLTAERARADERDSSDGEATLHLPREGQIVQRESSRALLGAVLGLPLQAREFVSALTGCANPGGNVSARMSGSNAMRVSVGNAFPVEHLLQRKGQQVSWTLAAIGRESPGRGFRWRAEYQRDSGEVLRSIRIVSEEANRATDRLFDLRFSLSQVQFAPLIVAETFSPRVPAGTRAVSLQAVQSARSRLPMVNGSR